MSPFARLREWLVDLVESETAGEEPDEAEPSSRLDPENVTEVRTRSTDDAAETLREVRERSDAQDDEGEG